MMALVQAKIEAKVKPNQLYHARTVQQLLLYVSTLEVVRFGLGHKDLNVKAKSRAKFAPADARNIESPAVEMLDQPFPFERNT
jgi:hypothetical protein